MVRFDHQVPRGDSVIALAALPQSRRRDHCRMKAQHLAGNGAQRALVPAKLDGSLAVIVAALHGHCRGHAVAADTGSAHSLTCRDIRNQADVCDQLSYRLLRPRSKP